MHFRRSFLLGGFLGWGFTMAPVSADDGYSQLKGWLKEKLPERPLRPRHDGMLGWSETLLERGANSLAKSAEKQALKWISSQLDGCVSAPKAGHDLFQCGAKVPAPGAARTIFVNGVWNDEPGARACATALAEKLGSTVDLLFNPGQFGCVDDLREAALDKAWPLSLGKLTLRKPVTQENSTTCHLASLLSETPGRINLVTHSQGCIIARNAILVAALRDPSVLERVAWVAVGSPLRSEEYLLAPQKFREITHPTDAVAQQLGRLPLPDQWPGGKASLRDLGWSDLSLLNFPATHGFTEAYLAAIDPADLWPKAE